MSGPAHVRGHPLPFRSICSGDQLARMFAAVREACWGKDGGELAKFPALSEAEREARRSGCEAALKALFIRAPLPMLLGKPGCERAALRLHALLQNDILNRHLVLTITDEFVRILFPELDLGAGDAEGGGGVRGGKGDGSHVRESGGGGVGGNREGAGGAGDVSCIKAGVSAGEGDVKTEVSLPGSPPAQIRSVGTRADLHGSSTHPRDGGVGPGHQGAGRGEWGVGVPGAGASAAAARGGAGADELQSGADDKGETAEAGREREKALEAALEAAMEQIEALTARLQPEWVDAVNTP